MIGIDAGRGAVSRRGGISLMVVGLAIGAAAGCADPTAPWSQFDPDRALLYLDDVVRPLDVGGDFLLGLDLAVITLEYHGTALASAMSPMVGDSDGVLRSRRNVRPGTAEQAALITEGGALTLPGRFTGETLVWDHSAGYVVSGRSGAPSSGVRFELYRMDGNTGYPLRPLSRIGYIDLIDEDGSTTEAVRVRAVRTTGSSRTIADYRVTLAGSGSYDAGDMLITAAGVMGDVGTVELDLSHRLAWSRSRDRDELTLDYRYRRGSASVSIEGRAVSRFDAREWETFDFESEIRGTRTTTTVEASIARTGSLRGHVRTDGRRVARISGYDGRPVFERSDGGRLSWHDVASLEELWTGTTDLVWVTDWILVPSDLLLLSG